MKKVLIYAAAVALVVSSCSKDINSFNENIKNPEEVPAPSLFANSLKELSDYNASPNVNINTFRLWSQHWTQTTYVDESNYELLERNINGSAFDRLYGRVLRDLSECKKAIDTDEFLEPSEVEAQKAMVGIVEAYAYTMLVDIFGDVPYTEALQGLENLTPAYDKAEDIYDAMAAQLDASILTLESNSPSSAFASGDVLFGGSSTAWVQFAASLKLRMAMRIADYDAGKAKTWAESVSGKCFPDDDPTTIEITSDEHYGAIMHYEGATPNTNPLWVDLVQSGRTDFIASKTLSTIMNNQVDPRSWTYFDVVDDTNLVVDTIRGAEHGRQSSAAAFSNIGLELEDQTHPGYLLTNVEVNFHLADAANRGWSTPMTAQEHYEKAIVLSMNQWGVSIDSFMLHPDVAWDAARADELIGTQKWIAMYDQGFEAWSTWRMYGYPAMALAREAGTVPPTRFNYSVDEFSVNNANVTAANGGGVDSPYNKVFWDVD